MDTDGLFPDRTPVRMYRVEFYRAEETRPFHSWAPFGARGPEAAEVTIRGNIAACAHLKGATLNEVARFVFWAVDDLDHATEGTVER